MDSQHHRSFRHGIFIFFWIFITVLLVVGIFFLIQLFRIKDITVSGDPAVVEINKKKFIGNTLFFPTDEMEKEILADNPLVKSVVIERKFPSKLELVITKRMPVARIVVQNGIVQGIDEESIVTGDVMDTQLPRIFTDIPAVRPGQHVTNAYVMGALRVLTAEKDSMRIMEFQEIDTASFRAHTDTLDIFFPQNTDLTPILDTLQTLMAGFRIKGTMPKTVDLRFGKPVVQF